MSPLAVGIKQWSHSNNKISLQENGENIWLKIAQYVLTYSYKLYFFLNSCLKFDKQVSFYDYFIAQLECNEKKMDTFKNLTTSTIIKLWCTYPKLTEHNS